MHNHVTRHPVPAGHHCGAPGWGAERRDGKKKIKSNQRATPIGRDPCNPPLQCWCRAPSSAGLLNANIKEGGVRGGGLQRPKLQKKNCRPHFRVPGGFCIRPRDPTAASGGRKRSKKTKKTGPRGATAAWRPNMQLRPRGPTEGPSSVIVVVVAAAATAVVAVVVVVGVGRRLRQVGRARG